MVNATEDGNGGTMPLVDSSALLYNKVSSKSIAIVVKSGIFPDFFFILGRVFPSPAEKREHMSSSKSQPASLLGLFLAGLGALRCVFLPNNTPLGRLFIPLALLGIGALGLWLLERSGCQRDTLMKLVLPIGLALFLRSLLLPHATLDYQDFLSKWVEHFRQNGGVLALKDPVGNYNVPYLYLLSLLSYLPIPDLYGIKLFSILFDVLLAWGGYRLARTAAHDGPAPELAFTLLLLLPTVVLNGACWGQCDSVWAGLCVLALASALEERPKTSLALLALAFAFKLQAIFLIPLWAGLWFVGRIKLRDTPIFPAVFALTMVPAMLFGKPAGDILRVYVDQAGSSVGWGTLNYNSPSVFTLFPYYHEFSPVAPKLAILCAFVLMLTVLALLLWGRERVNNGALILAGAVLSLGIPYLLPYMHERYFFLGGVLLVVWACLRPRHAPAAAGAEIASLGGYHAYLMTKYVMTVSLFGLVWTQLTEGLLMLFALLTAFLALVGQTCGKKFPKSP